MWKSCTRALISFLKCSPFFSQPTALKDPEAVSDPPDPPKRKPGGWKSVPFIIGNETFERMASYGITANFTVYLLKKFHIEAAVAASISNVFLGTVNFAPLIGGFIADAYCGRFWTIAYGSISSLLGMLVLTLTASVPQLRPPTCSHSGELSGDCSAPSRSQLGVLILALVLLAIGSGGVRPCSLPFGADQFHRGSAAARRSFFNWYYCTSTAGVVVGMTVMVYVQDSVSWAIGFGVPAVCMLCSIVFFFVGTKVYVYVAPEGSVFGGIGRVLVAAYRKRGAVLPEMGDAARQQAALYDPAVGSEGVMKLPLTLQFRFLNKAAIILPGEVNPAGGGGDPTDHPWTLCSVQMIEQVKLLIRIIPIWASGIIFFISVSQQWTFSVLQSLTMDRRLGSGDFRIPAASVGIISLAALTVFIPVYDRVIVRVLCRVTGQETGLSLLQRQGVGLFVSVVSMVVGGAVEGRRRRGAEGMSAVAWLGPQLVLMGVAEAFNAVGQVEFYNQQFPEQMQTIAGSLFYCSLAGAGYLSSVLIAVVQKATGRNGRHSWLAGDINSGHLDYFYYVIAVMGMANFVYFLVCAHFYRYKGTREEEKVVVVDGGGLHEVADDAFVGEKEDNGMKE